MADPMDFAAFLLDPHGTIAAARTHGPVVPTEGGPAMVIEHEAVRSLLGDPRLEVNFVEMLEAVGITSGPFHDWMAYSPLNNEGDDHRRWRAFMNRTFTPARVRQVQPFLAAEADRLVADLARRGEVELMADLADVLPALGLCELIGVPAEDREHFAALAHTIGLGFRPMQLLGRGRGGRRGERDARLHRRVAGPPPGRPRRRPGEPHRHHRGRRWVLPGGVRRVPRRARVRRQRHHTQPDRLDGDRPGRPAGAVGRDRLGSGGGRRGGRGAAAPPERSAGRGPSGGRARRGGRCRDRGRVSRAALALGRRHRPGGLRGGGRRRPGGQRRGAAPRVRPRAAPLPRSRAGARGAAGGAAR
ncbi:MAG: hypothetical protein R2746_15135 [Acidimicrobiales bacterium]